MEPALVVFSADVTSASAPSPHGSPQGSTHEIVLPARVASLARDVTVSACSASLSHLSTNEGAIPYTTSSSDLDEAEAAGAAAPSALRRPRSDSTAIYSRNGFSRPLIGDCVDDEGDADSGAAHHPLSESTPGNEGITRGSSLMSNPSGDHSSRPHHQSPLTSSRVLVGNLPKRMCPRSVRRIAEQFGEVRKVWLAPRRATLTDASGGHRQRTYQIGYIDYVMEDAAEDAVDTFQRSKLGSDRVLAALAKGDVTFEIFERAVESELERMSLEGSMTAGGWQNPPRHPTAPPSTLRELQELLRAGHR